MIDTKYIEAYRDRVFNSFYNESPRKYPEDAAERGKEAFEKHLSKEFTEIAGASLISSSEVSPFTGDSLEISYARKATEHYIDAANNGKLSLSEMSIDNRFDMLKFSLEGLQNRFFELAYATMHTTGQSFMMSFQASGPHAADRALEAMVASYLELNAFPSKVDWVKDFGKFQLTIKKDFVPVSKGIGLVIGCSTFPTWNSVTAIYANIMCGNPVIVKPHPTSVLPMAIVVSELRKAALSFNVDPEIVQMATDTLEKPITKEFIEHVDVKLIDYTGGNVFGDYIESIKGKVTFTEKAGVNCCLIDSVTDINKVAGNIAFSVSLYSGQMCTAPQNIFVPEDGIKCGDKIISYDDVIGAIKSSIVGLVENPKAGPGTLGAIQSENTLNRVNEYNDGTDVILESQKGVNSEFEKARVATPMIIEKASSEYSVFSEECFGPIIFIVKTRSTGESIDIAKKLAQQKGALTCLCYSTDEKLMQEVKATMNSVFVPVSFNFSGAGFVNQHAAFSDLHVTGGNPAGNATFTNSEYVSKRFVWVGNRYM